MVWVGFLSIYVILGLLFLLMIISRNLFDRFKMTLSKFKCVWCAIVFTLCSFILTLFYSMLAIVTGNLVINALLCTVFLVFSWFVEEKLYQLLTEEKSCKNSENKILLKEDKNVCNLFSLIGVIIFGTIQCYEDRSLEFVVLISIAISILIGAYIPISEIYNSTPAKELICTIIKEFRCKKVSVWISAILSVIVITISALKFGLIVQLNEKINDFVMGMSIGSIVMVVVFTILDFIKRKKWGAE